MSATIVIDDIYVLLYILKTVINGKLLRVQMHIRHKHPFVRYQCAIKTQDYWNALLGGIYKDQYFINNCLLKCGLR